jgi:hypothetical protein
MERTIFGRRYERQNLDARINNTKRYTHKITMTIEYEPITTCHTIIQFELFTSIHVLLPVQWKGMSREGDVLNKECSNKTKDCIFQFGFRTNRQSGDDEGKCPIQKIVL